MSFWYPNCWEGQGFAALQQNNWINLSLPEAILEQIFKGQAQLWNKLP